MMDAGTAIVRQRIRIAQEALNARMLDLTASREDSGELLEIAKAMRKLADLKRRHKVRWSIHRFGRWMVYLIAISRAAF